MNILIDGQTLQTPEVDRGIGVYFKNVLNNMVKRSYVHNWYITVSDKACLQALDPWVAQRLHPVVDPAFAPGTDYGRTDEYTAAMERVVARKDIHIFWCPNPLMVNVLFLNRALNCRIFATLYDLIPAIMPVPEWSEAVRAEYQRRLDYLRVTDMELLCISEATKADFENHIRPRDGLHVTLLAADENKFYRPRTTAGVQKKPRIVFTGGFDYRKNMNGALQAFARACKKDRGDRLVQNAEFYLVCSAGEEKKKEFYKYAKKLKIGGRVHLTGFIPDEELAALYQTCDVFFFPSLYEGFGLPILEAMLGGAYVLSANNSSLPEICGEHALLCDANDVNDMADKLAQALRAAEQESVAEKNARQEYARRFSWDRTAAETLALFTEDHKKREKRKIALATPWPTQKTGIANFVYKMIPYLVRYFDVDIFVDEQAPATEEGLLPYDQGEMFPLDSLEARYHNYDKVIYEFGNSSDFHTEIYRKLKELGGIAEIHDHILHPFLYRSFFLTQDYETYREALTDGYGHEGEAHYQDVLNKVTAPDIEKYPMCHSVANISEAAIVHNHWSYDQINDTAVRIIPHAAFDKEVMAEDVKQQRLSHLKDLISYNGEVIIGFLGFVNPNKRPMVLLSAVKKLLMEGYKVKLVFWGNCDLIELEEAIIEQDMSDSVFISGYLDKASYEAALEMSDIIVNLRYPSMGESSGTLCEAFKYGKPVIVSDVNQYREYPDSVCWKVPVDKYEADMLAAMLRYLVDDPAVRDTLGGNAKAYAESVLAPDEIAKMYWDVVDDAIRADQERKADLAEKPLALVIPWYGSDIRGGAEMECRYLAHSLQNAGQTVEVFTTCVKDAASDRGRNTLRPGKHIEEGIVVRRFLVREDRDVDRYNVSNLRIFNNEPFTVEDEKTYFREDINSDDMYRYIRRNADGYRAFLFLPYMYGVTYNGPAYCRGKSIMTPCLHDESYAYMQVLQKSMNALKGMIFNSSPEDDLAHRIFGLDNVKTVTLGVSLDTDWYASCDGDRFREKYGLRDDFILFAGRKDAGKKADELIEYFIRYREQTPESTLKLVLIGGGKLPVEVPEGYQNDVIDLGFIPAEDKHDAFAACTVFCNPSYFESFSIVIMEAWVAKRPVMVSAHCAVTANFARESNGGLWYADYGEFKGSLDYLLSHPAQCQAMGENGFSYVMEHFTHEKIAQSYLKFIEDCGL